VQSLTKQATQRLEAIQQMEELGSGFYLAMHDLEIRGAGEVLGENQSGNMMEIGFQLYNEMLAEAVRSLKAGREPDLLAPMQAAHRHQPARPRAAARLLRRRAPAPVVLQAPGHGRRASKIDTLLEEIVDRFGKLPTTGADAVRHAPPARAEPPYGVQKIDAAPGVINITFRPTRRSSHWRIIELVQKNRTSSWPATTSCASSAPCPTRRRARSWCATCCAAWRRPNPP
jgi:transcription-repair coupling factor (superfamily II helicase)